MLGKDVLGKGPSRGTGHSEGRSGEALTCTDGYPLEKAKLGLTALLSNSQTPLCPILLPGNQTKCLAPPSGAFSHIIA